MASVAFGVLLSAGPRPTAADICTEMYSPVTSASAATSAIGIVRVGRSTSPPRAITLSGPEKAKISTRLARPMVPKSGSGPIRHISPPPANAAAATRTSSGASLATVITSATRVPCRTPRTLIHANVPRMAATIAVRATWPSSGGTSAPTAAASPAITAATARVSLNQPSAPVRNPASGPNAASAYTAVPPVDGTRLPATAKARTMHSIASAQARYA